MDCNLFQTEPLPYAYDGLEPYIDGQTMRVHHDVLYQRYVDKLNAALKKYPKYYCYSLEELILGYSYLPKEISETVFNQAGGAFNHRFYFDILHPGPTTLSQGNLRMAIEQSFGSFDAFRKNWKEKAMAVFGSGWTWLCVGNGGLEIINTANQVTPLSVGRHPILCIDIWEHAYFLQYQAERESYIDAWFCVVDWNKAEKYYMQYCDFSKRI